MPAGRPPHFKNPKEMQVAIDDYFDNVMSKYEVGNSGITVGRPAVSELAYHLGMSTRSFVDYAHKDDFSPTIKRARQRIEMELEKALFNGQCTGIIFNLKNNFGWKDKQEVESVNTHKHTIENISELSNAELDAIIEGGTG